MPLPAIAELPARLVFRPQQEGVVFPENGEGLTFGPKGIEFPPVAGPDAVDGLFPAYMPNCEQIVWNELNDATQPGAVFFPEHTEPEGLSLPLTFQSPPDIGMFSGRSPGELWNGKEIPPVKVVKGFVPYPGTIPSIGVIVGTENEDGSDKIGNGGFAGDAIAVDNENNIIASTAYYAEPLYSTVIVELIHENRDERDRLHNVLRRRLYPLRHRVPSETALVKELAVQNEKQELPLDEQPLTLYISLFTVEMWSEALMPTEVLVGGGYVGQINVNVEVEA